MSLAERIGSDTTGVRFLAEGRRVTWSELMAQPHGAPGAVVTVPGATTEANVRRLFAAIAAGACPVVVGDTTPALPERSDAVLIQLTSGTTGDPRPLEIPEAALLAYLEAAAKACGRTTGDVVVSWLPLQFDLGLITAVLGAAVAGCELVLAPPEAFRRAPGDWLAWLSEFRGTHTYAPSFAYGIAAAFARPGIDLTCVRFAANGGETVAPAAARRFLGATAPLGFDPGAMCCGYGLAEAVSAVTVRRPGQGFAERDGLASCGAPLPGVDVRIAEGGEIEVTGPTVVAGGRLRTGDLGFLADGELYVSGRIKDLIVLAGRNVAPEEIERAAGGVALAFGIAGAEREEVVVLAEGGDRDAIARAVRAQAGVTPHDVVLVERVPRTAAGKLQRAAARERYLAGDF